MSINFKIGGITKLDILDCCYDIISISYALHDIETAVWQNVVNCLSKKLKVINGERQKYFAIINKIRYSFC
jgi:hypothetical protein